MVRSPVRPRTALVASLALTLTTLVAAPAEALVDPDGNTVVVDDGLEAHDDSELLSTPFARASAVEAAAAPKAKKRLKTLVVPVFWSGAGKDTSNAKVKKRAKSVMKKADTYFRTVSRGRIGHSTTVLPWQKIPRPAVACGIYSQMEHIGRTGSARAKRAGKNPARYDRVIFYVTQKACGKDHYGVAGLGSMPGRYVWLEGTFAPNVVIHELGHNLGLGHSSYTECRAKNGRRTILAAARYCTTHEYGDATDVMGNHPDAGWFSGPKLARLGWLSGKNLAKNTRTKKKTYTLRPVAASSTKLKVVRVKGTKGRTYWVEYRARTGLDKKIAPGLAGVQVRIGKPGTFYGDSNVLDMLPADYADWFDIQSVALGARSSWTSPEGIWFSVGSLGTTAKVTVQRKAGKAKKPLAPTPTVTATDRGATLTWPYPKDRGTPVQSYTVRLTSSAGLTETLEVSQLDGPVRRAELTNLDPTTTYSVAVRSRNERGSSPWSSSVKVKPLDLPPAVTIHSPAKDSRLKAMTPVQVQVTPSIPKGSSATLQWVEACLYDTSGGHDLLVSDCGYVSSWQRTISSGKKLTLTVTPDWVDTATELVLRAEVQDSFQRTVQVDIPVTVVP